MIDRIMEQDGAEIWDEAIIRAFFEKNGAPRIGFGECHGVILAAE